MLNHILLYSWYADHDIGIQKRKKRWDLEKYDAKHDVFHDCPLNLVYHAFLQRRFLTVSTFTLSGHQHFK